MINWAIEEILIVTAIPAFVVGFWAGFWVAWHHFSEKVRK